MLRQEGLVDYWDITAEVVDGSTVIPFGATTITLSGLELTFNEVWGRIV